MSVKIEVWGEYACFTRSEFKVERVSYDVLTPSAARGLLEAIFWHPGLRWVIDKIYVCNPIQFTNIRRNEVKSKIPIQSSKSLMLGGNGRNCIITSDDIQQRAAMILKNVRYVIEAHFEMTEHASATDSAAKFISMFNRRAEKGQCYHQPYLGCREFPAYFKPFEKDEIPTVYGGKELDLGYMLYDMDYSDRENIVPMYFRAIMKNGCIDVSDCEVLR